MFQDAAIIFAVMTLPVLMLAVVCVVIGNYLQGGLALSTEALKPKSDRLNPVNNLKRVFGPDSIVNLTKSSIKLILIAAVSYTVLEPVVSDSPGLMTAPVQVIASKLGDTLYSLALRCGLVLLAFSAADYGYAWYKHEKSIRMSKQEIRDEFKEQEGDPMVKGQRRRAGRALAQRRSLEAVPTASVVVTNPTHFAVALRYEPESDAAPVVVAKGADNVAAKIREIAKESDVPLIENPPLARALFKVVEPNQIIPAEFFGPVAELLAYVFRQKEKAKAG
jgi:flagellar biosynthetic protein FlhB